MADADAYPEDIGSVGGDLAGMAATMPLTVHELMEALTMFDPEAYIRVNLACAGDVGVAGFVWSVTPCQCDMPGCANGSMQGMGVVYA